MKQVLTGIVALFVLTAALSFTACSKAPAASVAASAASASVSVAAPQEQTVTGLVTKNEKDIFAVETGLAAVTFTVKDGEVPSDAVVDARVEITYLPETKTAAAKLIRVTVLPQAQPGKVQPMHPGPVVTKNIVGTVVDATMSTVTIAADGVQTMFGFAENEPEINCPVRIGVEISITYEGEISADGNTNACTVVRIDAAGAASGTSAAASTAK